MIKDKVLTKIIEDVALAHNITIDEVDKVHILPYRFIRTTLSKLDIKNKHSYELAEGIKTNFAMPALYKLYLDKPKLNKIVDYVKKMEELKEEE